MEDTILSVICYLISAHLSLTMVFKEDLWIKASVYLPIYSNKVLGHSSQYLYYQVLHNCYLANIVLRWAKIRLQITDKIVSSMS